MFFFLLRFYLKNESKPTKAHKNNNNNNKTMRYYGLVLNCVCVRTVQNTKEIKASEAMNGEEIVVYKK